MLSDKQIPPQTKHGGKTMQCRFSDWEVYTVQYFLSNPVLINHIIVYNSTGFVKNTLNVFVVHDTN